MLLKSEEYVVASGLFLQHTLRICYEVREQQMRHHASLIRWLIPVEASFHKDSPKLEFSPLITSTPSLSSHSPTAALLRLFDEEFDQNTPRKGDLQAWTHLECEMCCSLWGQPRIVARPSLREYYDGLSWDREQSQAKEPYSSGVRIRKRPPLRSYWHPMEL